MTDRERLLRRVCLAPDDDVPRLIFADWCDEQGEQERAEFIRVQCLFASRYPPSIDDRLHCTKPFRAGINMVSVAGVPKGTPMATCGVCEVCRDMKGMRLRELELLHHHEREWMGELGPHTWINPSPYNESRACWVTTNATTWIAPKWERGWIVEITCEAAQWLAHGPAIVQQQPITRVVLSDREPQDYHNNAETFRGRGRLYGWRRAETDRTDRSYHLVPEWWDIVADHPDRIDNGWWADFNDRKVAIDAANAAALLWARQESGLEVTA